MPNTTPVPWAEARETAWAAGYEHRGPATELPFAEAVGSALAAPLVAVSDLPAFPTSAIDGWAVAGPGPWRIGGEVLAGQVPQPMKPGVAVKIATGAQVPEGTEGIIRLEHSEIGDDDLVDGPPAREWREPGEEAAHGEELLPSGAPVTPPVIGLAAAAGHATLPAHGRPAARVVVFGDELLTSGVSREGRVRDSLGPMVPPMLTAAGAATVPSLGPVEDTLDAHVAALRVALAEADLVCTTGGTMVGPVDHLHPALAEIGAEYVINTVAVRPGFPMLLARTPDGKFIAGLPGNPQSAVIAVVTLVAPLLAGLRGLPLPPLRTAHLAEDVPGRGNFTHLALIDRAGRRLGHHGSAMLRGLAGAAGFAVVGPDTEAAAGATVDLATVPGV
ncbi:molybdopterin molybdotransferase MoeA [Glycomyces sp. TRM65418]|uniref:molybdopterin molybdotransferase MoeA n=1 Tax=Glycomyces sp. TRM65418 TaxID=2867006 RepID=UPI001CE4C995|nr:molybdopterin molybdotransferase MoeA [Glycomyces sp. TRM65418]MCC3763906.1 molybdopterin molybdotransferase MoeA [Glycomyces sp. TRM65418]QZD53608.1 molybdopterin molybdotransferase MoeA [Glycomyces sp. TRM65418]